MADDRRGAWLEDLTWPDVRAWLDRDPVLVVPIGAICKQHALHLPMNTDFLVARELADRVARELEVLIAPVISYGYYPTFVRYPGSLHLSAETFLSILNEVLGKFIQDGFQHIAIINTGVSTEGPVNIAARDLYLRTGVRVRVADIRRMGTSAESQIEQQLGGHADERETSTLLAIRPDLVHMDRARQDYGNQLDAPKTVFTPPSIYQDDPSSIWDHSLTGARGDPSLASLEKGEAILQAMASDLTEGIRAHFPDQVGQSPSQDASSFPRSLNAPARERDPGGV